MADEAFALSPIAARAALPSEQDYDAIREAFMETSRGRWFLGEYAKRNRNSDTTMVLDAVARIEQAMAAQRQEPARNDDALLEALAAIRSTVEQAEAAASGAVTELRLDEKLAPIHKGARIIKEISWRWREIGADGRICDLIDSQISAIEASCTEIANADGGAALGAAFDLLRQKLDELADGEETEAKVNAKANGWATAEVAVAAASMPEPAAVFDAERPAVDEAPAGTAFAEPELPPGTPLPEAAVVAAEAEPIEAAAAVPEIEPAAMSAQAADARAPEQAPQQVLAQDLARDAAHQDDPVQSELAQDTIAEDELAQDEAVLEMVAIEMGAPDDSVDEFLPEEMAEVETSLPPVVAPAAARAPEQPPAPRFEVPPPSHLRLEVVSPAPTPQILPELAPPVAPEPSLGSTLIASGILPRPRPPSDPLAPIRRMSQAEKIAFFS